MYEADLAIIDAACARAELGSSAIRWGVDDFKPDCWVSSDNAWNKPEHLGGRAARFSLKSSLERVGQNLHPITVRPNGAGFELVTGEHRLRAAEALGWRKIRARVGRFSDDELREIEVDENQVRLDLTEYEASKAKLRQILAAEDEEEAERISAQDEQKRRGRPRGGNSEAARRTGLDKEEVRRTKKHVEVADAYPVFQGAQWKRSQGESRDLVHLAAEIKLRAEWKLGRLLSETVRPRGAGNTQLPGGVTKMQSHRWQLVHAVPEPELERYLASAEEPTTAALGGRAPWVLPLGVWCILAGVPVDLESWVRAAAADLRRQGGSDPHPAEIAGVLFERLERLRAGAPRTREALYRAALLRVTSAVLADRRKGRPGGGVAREGETI